MGCADERPRDENPGDAQTGAARGTEHLQAAGRELIAAARAFLDVAEEAVEDSQVVEEAGSMIRDVMQRMGATTHGVDLRDTDSDGSARDGTDPDGTDSNRTDSDATDPAATDPAGTADAGPDGTGGGRPGRRGTRVRRIDVE